MRLPSFDNNFNVDEQFLQMCVHVCVYVVHICNEWFRVTVSVWRVVGVMTITSASIDVLCIVLKSGNVDDQSCKSNFVPVHCMKAYGDTEVISPLILNLGTRQRSAVSFMPWPHHLLVRALSTCWIWDCVGFRAGLDTGEEEILLFLPVA
jgi:hypothetical protein